MANEYLKRTPTSSGNKKVFTISIWIKSSGTTTGNVPLNTFENGQNFLSIRTGSPLSSTPTSDSVLVYQIDSGTDYSRYWDSIESDFSSWTHHLFAFNSTSLDVSERICYYRNGAKIKNYNDYYGTFPQNFEFKIDTSRSFDIFKNADHSTYGTGQLFDYFFVDGQALTPDVFGFYKDGDGYMSSGTSKATDFRNGQWSPHSPKKIKKDINRRGGFGVNGFYLPMNDSSNPGADFHMTPNSIIKLKGEDLPQPQNGAPETSDAFVSQLREETGTLGFDGCVKIDAGDYLTVPSSSDFAYGTGDFTWEAFVFSSALSNDSTSANYLFDHGSDGGMIQFYDGLIRYYNTTTGASGNLYTKGGGLQTSTWHHVAVARQSGTTRLFVDGQLRTSQADTHNYSSQAVTIGDYGGHTGSNEWDGFISNLRLIKGTALYTANFTPPTEPLTAVTNTKLLCCQSSTDATAAVIPTGTYVQNWTENTSSGLDSYNGIGAIYDGQLGTSNRGGNNSSHDGSYETLFDGQSVSVSSTIEIYWNGVGAGQRVIRVNGTTEINGGSSALTPGWDSHSFSGTVTKLEVKTANTSSYAISAVRIDSNILTTPLTANGNVFATRNELTGSTVLAVPGIALENTNTELVTNGTFDSDNSSWNGTGISELHNSFTTSQSGGYLILNSNTNSGSTYGVSQNVTTVNGTRYTLSFDIVGGTGNGRIRVENGSSGSNVRTTVSGLGFGRHSFSFIAGDQAVSRVFLGRDSSTNGGTNATVHYDNVSVKEAMPVRDYSADIKGSGTNKTPTVSGNAGVGYELGGYYGSAMTFDGSGDYLSIADSADFDMGTGDFTLECWVNSIDDSDYQGIFGSGDYGADSVLLQIANTGVLRLNAGGVLDVTGTSDLQTGQWNHIVMERYNGRLYGYVNGVAEINTSYTNSIDWGHSSNLIVIGAVDVTDYPGQYQYKGLIQDLRLYKGVAKYKGGFDVPKPYTPVGIESWRTTADTCKNNFATLNSLITRVGSSLLPLTFTDGNLTATANATGDTGGSCGIAVISGKWYAEYRINTNNASGSYRFSLSVNPADKHWGMDSGGDQTGSIHFRPFNAQLSSASGLSFSTIYNLNYTIAIGDIIGVALDMDNRQVSFYKNGSLITQSNGSVAFPYSFSGTNSTSPYGFGLDIQGTGANQLTLNFGQNPSFSGNITAGTNADGNGKGLFKYAPPSGFLALCEDNLPAPAISDPGEHFKTVLYTGDGVTDGRSITGVGFQPDLVWIKRRDVSNASHIVDSVRGARLAVASDLTLAEWASQIGSFSSDGFSMVGTGAAVNYDGGTYVAWCWKAGGPAVTNTDGSLTSQVSANPTAGFSIVFTNGSGTAGHGLNSTPKFIIQKRTAAASSWSIQHHQMMTSSTGKILFDTTEVVASSAPYMFNATATTFEPTYTDPCISYCWTEIEGFSKFGSYAGNGDPDGPFVYCGFKPAWVMTKRTDTTGEWWMYDSSRGSTNPIPRMLLANSSGTENEDSASYMLDFLSNGFKIRSGLAALNGDGGTFIFMAFAESPFQTANAK